MEVNDSALHLHLKPAPILESEVGGRGGAWRLMNPFSTSTSSLHLSLSRRLEVEVENGGLTIPLSTSTSSLHLSLNVVGTGP